MIPDYLDEFDELAYRIDGRTVALTNLKAMNGMAVAELLTYLYDDGFVEFGPMDASAENGYLMMVRPEDRS